MKHTGKSLEDAIRSVHQKYKNKPSPLTYIDPENSKHNINYVPQQVTPKTDSRSALVGDFKPTKYTF